MNELHFPTTAGQIGNLLGAEVRGDAEARIDRLSSLAASEPGSLTFLSENKFQPLLQNIRGGVVITSEGLADKKFPLTYLLIENPKLAFASVAKYFMPPNPWRGIAPTAFIHESARLAENVGVGPGAVICENAEIGQGTVIYPNVYVGPGVKIGEACEIHPGTVLLVNVTIGNRVRIFSGSVIGSEGFGFLEGANGLTEMPQLGRVLIEDDVRMGANCTVDRGTLGETRVGAGTKMDDHAHVGHNVIVGKNCVLCAQVGIAGSAILEDGVMLGGQVGVGNALTIGAGARVGGQAGVGTNLAGGQSYFLTPALEMGQALKVIRLSRKLPELAAKIRKLEERLNDRT